jgi:hypothetical protein
LEPQRIGRMRRPAWHRREHFGKLGRAHFQGSRASAPSRAGLADLQAGP